MMRVTLNRRIFESLIYAFLLMMCILMIIPIIKVVSESFSSTAAIQAGGIWLWPKGFTFDNYRTVLADPSIGRAFRNSVTVTIVGTAINLVMTCLLAYPTIQREFAPRKYILLMIVITLVISAPLIPNYLLVKQLGMVNTLWAVMIPGAISSFNFFILRSFFRGLSEELIDAARIDGCGEFRILLQIVIPLSKAALAAIGLFYAVSHWNNLQANLVYLQSPELLTLQVKLYNTIVSDVEITPDLPELIQVSPDGIRVTTIVIATVPIVLVYPFLQKYFIQGATLGSLKE